jgi:aryl-phospho-beta-D-glucosidase BglC (GH1 family)
MIKQVTKELQITELYAVFMISVMLVGIFSFFSVIASPSNSATIRSSGTIVTILPLHVEGRYIKNSLNQTVILRGVNKVEFADDPDGIWMGSTIWNDANVAAELDAMKSWGINVIRCHISVELWKYDIGPGSGHPASPYCAISTRTAIKRLLTMAAERGIYVVLDGYTVRSYWSGGEQDPLPYPPYQLSLNASEVIANETEFINWWVGVAQELKYYPNVLFELWNEPVGNETAKASWGGVAQQTIDAIRSTGAQQIIIFQWGYGVYAGLASPSGSEGVEWILDFNLTDPSGNLMYSTHVYRVYGGCGLWQTLAQEKGTLYGYLYDDVKRAFQIEKLDWVGDTLNKPLFIGETGCDMAWTGDELQRELIAWNNTLGIFHEWGINYAAFWWRDIGVFRLLEHGVGWSNGVPPPSDGGEILINWLARK